MSIEKIETGMRKWLLLATPMDPWPHCDPEHVRAILDELSRRQELIDRARSLVPRVYANWHADARAISEREGQDG